MNAPATLESILRSTAPLNPDYTCHVGEYIFDPTLTGFEKRPRWVFNGLSATADGNGVNAHVTPLIDDDDQTALMGYLSGDATVEAWVCDRFPWLALTPVLVMGTGMDAPESDGPGEGAPDASSPHETSTIGQPK